MKTKAYLMSLMLATLLTSVMAQIKTITFQQGLNGYTGCADKELRNPETNYGKGPKEDSLLISEY